MGRDPTLERDLRNCLKKKETANVEKKGAQPLTPTHNLMEDTIVKRKNILTEEIKKGSAYNHISRPGKPE